MNETEITTGVYAIVNLTNEKLYVGSAARSFEYRWFKHRNDLRRGVHHSIHLQRAWDKSGESNFNFVVIETCSPEECLKREQYYLDLYQAANAEFGYNLCPIAGSNLGRKGYKHSQAACEAKSIRQLGREVSEETRRKIGAGNAIALKGKPGHKVSEETKQAISRARKGKPLSQEHRQKLSLAKLGKSWSLKRRNA